MGDFFSNLELGFSVAFTLHNLGLCFLGCLVGTLIGVLPGIGPIATITMLLPVTFGLPPVGALIMLAGIYYGAQYGGSTTAILVNIPGEVTSVVTTLDGHQMARQGRAGVALGIAALGSFFAGCVATLIIAGLAVPLTRVALLFGPSEYCGADDRWAWSFAVVLARGSILKSIAMVLLGLLLSTVGHDLETGRGADDLRRDDAVRRHRLRGAGDGAVRLRRGDAQPGRWIRQPRRGHAQNRPAAAVDARISGRRLRPDRCAGRCSGAVLGILPGNGAVLGTVRLATRWRRSSPGTRALRQGSHRGGGGPESANNAGAQTSFIPLLTLGIPPNAVMALMVGAMTIHGIVPGPLVMTKEPEPVLGRDRQHVDREPHAAGDQPAAGRRLGAPAARCRTG